MLKTHCRIKHIFKRVLIIRIVILQLLLRTQTVDGISSAIHESYKEKMCISGSMVSSINGIYEYSSWDSNRNGSIYYNVHTNQYLYPWIYSQKKKYLISNDTYNNISVASTQCDIKSTDNIFNVQDCSTNWISNINNQLMPDTELRLVQCNDICISDNIRPELDGVYKWINFDPARNTSIYQHDNMYLYGCISGGSRFWGIDEVYISMITCSGESYCYLGLEQDVLSYDIEYCQWWKTWINNAWSVDINVIVHECLNAPTSEPTASPISSSDPSTSPSDQPTNSPSLHPSLSPSDQPTQPPLNTDNIIITTDNEISRYLIAFNVSNIDSSCGGSIHSVEITDLSLYKNEWINYSINNNKYYEWRDLMKPFTVPISIRISKHNNNSQEMEIIEAKNVIYLLNGGINFDFGNNFCENKMNSNNIIHFWDEYFLYLIILTVIIFICLIVCIFIIIQRNRKQKKKDDGRCISNALAAVIAIGDYENGDLMSNPDIKNGHLMNLPVEKDVKNLTQLFKLLNYKMILNKGKISWTEEEIINYLYEIGKALFNEHNELKYDALIVFVSCHGTKNKIITSDYRTIEKTVLHRIISIEHPEIREIPRIFLFDSCDGSSERQYAVKENESKDEEKGKGISLIDISTGYEWTNDTKNPDYNLVQINAANAGFQAKCSTVVGSFLIYLFTQKMKRNIIKKTNKTLATICYEIENELHDKGVQQTTNTFHNDTRNLKFKINNSNHLNNERVLSIQSIPSVEDTEKIEMLQLN